MSLSVIVAMDRSGVIGRAGGLPWRLSSDLRRFKSLTMGHHLIMGRKTFDSLGKFLPGRILLILKRLSSPYDHEYFRDGKPLPTYEVVVAARELGNPPPTDFAPVAFVHSLDDALRLSSGDREVFVIGGAEIFSLALPRVEKMYVTWVEAEITGDTFFPPIDWSGWRQISAESLPADEKNEYPTTFCIYERNR